MTFFDIGLILASVICLVGIVRRVAVWSRSPGGAKVDHQSMIRQLLSAVRSFFLDVLLLSRTGRTGMLRWVAHSLVFFGFIGLLLFHALDDYVTVYFFPAYESTLDPWQFIRNLLGLMVLVGVSIMVVRRLVDKRLRSLTRFQDWAAILVVGMIILSGFFLESSKIVSPAVFDRMVRYYYFPESARDLTALKAFWAREYGVVFSAPLPLDDETVEFGASLNEDNCSDCHADTASAFVSKTMATVGAPLAPALNRSGADSVFWYLHIIFCFIGLAALPFGKFLHPLSAPANMLVRGGRRDGAPVASGAAKGLGLDACTRCGECSLHCSVAPSFSVLGNDNILPSEKLRSLHDFRTDSLTEEGVSRFAEGSRICTECLRCTDICSAGINLQDLWIESKKEAAALSPDSNGAVRALPSEFRIAAFEGSTAVPPLFGLADNAESYWACVQCTTCTSVCPVVAVSEDPTRDLDMTPQQIMNLLRMGLKDQAMGVRMVWSCTTCYKCQEHCPQNIRVADVLYEQRNTAAARLREDEE
ncbi:Heterodisulfide reductase subunit C-like protein [Pseudodesulfovibrio profundus]|uniref:Heterodisulfide reductase subunit C-like protein n=1 Tax=Pseudodesulfovibrio profundus TaxID=57320 RepID=A0A2C8FCL9_9BACT|nr:4Fe-4S dicluster domain-containing protein [Pseudodesulfovibrio profundus]SOB60169.1 Heterodisulfide reductase subunit C-like protein [Pseudodesulfovibrio profundus]